jgi:heat shock protein HslJ
MKLFLPIVLGASLLSLGCRSGGDPAKDGGSAAPLFGTEWTLASMDYEGGFLVMSSPKQHPTLLLVQAEDGTTSASGFAGVNRFHGGCELSEDGSLSFGALISTRMAGDAEVMKLEAAYLAHLDGTTSYDLSTNGLTLQTDGGKLVFQAAAAID